MFSVSIGPYSQDLHKARYKTLQKDITSEHSWTCQRWGCIGSPLYHLTSGVTAVLFSEQPEKLAYKSVKTKKRYFSDNLEGPQKHTSVFVQKYAERETPLSTLVGGGRGSL